MNAGFEDCIVLNGLIDKHQENWTTILSEYQQLRKPDADAIADLALNNFVEMRDKVGDPRVGSASRRRKRSRGYAAKIR